MNQIELIHCSHVRELLISLLLFESRKNSILIIRESNYLGKALIVKLLSVYSEYVGQRIFIVNARGRTRYLSHKLLEVGLCFRFKAIYSVVAVHAFCDAVPFVKIFKDKRIYLYEHGLINYQLPKDMRVKKTGLLKRIKNALFFEMHPSYGHYEFVDRVYLFNAELISNSLVDKVCSLDLSDYWRVLSVSGRERVVATFLGHNKSGDFLEVACADAVLFTQPISEHGFVTEAHKIDIYKRVINMYSNYRILIKPHPRETTDYQKYFCEQVIDGTVPFELYNLLGMKVKTAITLYSSIENIFAPDVEVVRLGVEFDSTLLNERGNFEL